MERKLAAIFSTDVQGYSRLMGEDEEGTVRTLTAYRDVMTSLIQQHRGRVVDSPGDNLLAEFASVVDAVQCAVAVQEELKVRNAELPPHRQMVFRIGVNLGDVLVESDRLYGDGVNIAARLEELAEGGGICISGTAYDQVKNKLALGYVSLGEHTVKNIADPVRVYQVQGEPVPAAPGRSGAPSAVRPRRRGVALVVAAIVLGGAGVMALWSVSRQPPPASTPVASLEPGTWPLPNKPSLAVLPFTNLSSDPQQAYFADGMTDDLITDLSKLSGLFVIARNSTFTYKGHVPDVRQVGRDLGVRYVLEGSIRRAGEQIRINAQLIDVTTGGHLWAERYDSDMDHVFVLQDTITRKIVAALAVTLTAGEQERLGRQETENVTAYDAFLEGWVQMRLHTPEATVNAIAHLERAIQFDPDFPRANAALAWAYWTVLEEAWHTPLGIRWGEAEARNKAYLRKAMAHPTPLAHQVASRWHVWRRQYEEAIAQAEHAIALDPNDPAGHVAMASALTWAGRAAEAVPVLERTMRLDPHYPAVRLARLGLAHFGMEQFDTAVIFYERAIKRNPNLPHWVLAAAYVHLGRPKEAADTLRAYHNVREETVPEQWPTFPSLNTLWHVYPYQHSRDWERLATGLHQAGLFGFQPEYLAQGLLRMYCAEKRLLQATTQERMRPDLETYQSTATATWRVINGLEGDTALLTTEEGTQLATFKRAFAAFHELSSEVVVSVFSADTPAERATARELFAGKGQAAFDTAGAALKQLGELLGSPPSLPLYNPTDASCQQAERRVRKEKAS